MMVVSMLAEALGQSEDGIRLLLGLFSGYLFAIIFRALLWDADRGLKNTYFAFTGLSLAYFCYGWDIKHSLITTFGSYMVMFWSGPNRATVFLVFVWNMGYLLWGYQMMETDGYDINWTTPQCMVALRLIAMAFDYRDRSRPESQMSRDQVSHHIKTLPALLEVYGFVYFFGGFLIGPQYSFRRYLSFVNGTLHGKTVNAAGKPVRVPVPVLAVLRKLGFGVFYLATYALFAGNFTSGFMLTEEFLEEWSLPARWHYVWWMGKFCLMKYLGSWLVAEGSAVLCGMAYQRDASDADRGVWVHEAFSNVEPYQFESSLSLQGIIESFNISTNMWVKNYLFRRLAKATQDKKVAMFASLFFLAIWHGFQVGYFFTFGFEYLSMQAATTLSLMLKPFRVALDPDPASGRRAPWKWAVLLVYWLLCYITRSAVLAYGLVSFEVLTFSKSLSVFRSLYFSGHVLAVLVLLAGMGVNQKKLQAYGEPAHSGWVPREQRGAGGGGSATDSAAAASSRGPKKAQ